MPKPSHYELLLSTVSTDVQAHPRDLTKLYADKLNITRAAANNYIQKLEREGWIARSGPKTRPTFSLGFRRFITQIYSLKDLEEHIVWERDFAPLLQLPKNIYGIAHHGFTEMLNNAIDHSLGTTVHVIAVQSNNRLGIFIIDNGIGVFEKIKSALNLYDHKQALFELSKGKLTTDASKHSGEGVFFTSRMFDFFSLKANDLIYTHDHVEQNDHLHDDIHPFATGTTVFMSISLDSQRTSAEIFNQYTRAPEDFDFSRTVVHMRLAAMGSEELISRSQAKRVVTRFDRFKLVELDFTGVDEIGQAFADELFRVYSIAHPQVELVPKHMNTQVERMWQRAIALKMQ